MLRKSRETTGRNVVIPATTESNRGDRPHDSPNIGTTVASAGGTHALSGRANRGLRGRAGATDERHSPPFQAQYSGQPWLRDRGAGGTTLPRAASTVRGIPGAGPVYVDRRRQDIRGSGGALQLRP